MMKDIVFAKPEFFYLFALLPVMLLWHWKVLRSKRNSLIISTTVPFEKYKRTTRQNFGWMPLFLRMLAVSALIVALARPQSSSKGQNVTTEGISIVLAMDISSSMLAEDLKPNRIEAAKKVALEFIDGRPNDLIGLVIFSGESFTQCPITSDHAVLKNMMSQIKSGLLEDGTALGEGLATAISRIKDSKSKSRVIVLMTDGVSNAGAISPVTAGEIAKTFGIRVYSIGVGTMGTAPYPFRGPFGIEYQNVPVQIDEAVLKQISSQTDARYFRATSTNKLKAIYAEIDKMEKTKTEVTEFRRHSEEYFPWALLAGAFLVAELLLRYTMLKSLP